GERWLMVVVAVLCFLASITAVGALAADRAAHGWAHQLRGEATVQVRPRVDETGPPAAARAAETLAGVEPMVQGLASNGAWAHADPDQMVTYGLMADYAVGQSEEALDEVEAAFNTPLAPPAPPAPPAEA
ncbi:MAG: hypothetical protein RSG56_06570, partial [Brevundimonas sp.]